MEHIYEIASCHHTTMCSCYHTAMFMALLEEQCKGNWQWKMEMRILSFPVAEYVVLNNFNSDKFIGEIGIAPSV